MSEKADKLRTQLDLFRASIFLLEEELRQEEARPAQAALLQRVKEMPRGELEKNYVCALMQIQAYKAELQQLTAKLAEDTEIIKDAVMTYRRER